MADRITDAERVQIVSYLEEGKSQGWIARETGRSKQSVSRIARAEGIESDITATKRAVEAGRNYDRATRLELGNEMFEKLREMVVGVTATSEMKDLATTFGILTDKRRLEDGEATDRRESRRTDFSLEEEFRKLDTRLEAEVEAEGTS